MSLGSSVPVAFLYVADRERALAFYCDVLALRLKSSDGFGDFIDMGTGLIRMTVMADRRPTPHPVLGWDVEDVHVTVAWMSERGVAFTVYEGMGQDRHGVWTAPDGAAKVAWFTDPDGNVLSLSSSRSA